MAIHYSPSSNTIACGRSGASLSTTEDQAQVSCKLCLRSLDKTTAPVAANRTPTLAELRAAARAAKAPAAKPAPAATVSVKAAWQQKLEQLPGRNRLPRGASRQAFV
ncbi:hypothetical protein [Phytopseudomonas punonensis]|uniref:Uncharacterized protein n=1 Tax=Phytopseudomonas punonensis TaxID=1220495 RepID=A0A1M6XI37_9GAMM|nr:hypothetical protein [Pseudomonas punonensis]SHL05586.1 hypothetical protein SAMN05216288_0934 [Pseudomonas punonensis]